MDMMICQFTGCERHLFLLLTLHSDIIFLELVNTFSRTMILKLKYM